MVAKLLPLFLGILMTSSLFAQNGNYRTRQSGSWGSSTTWERDADSNGSFEESPSSVAPTTPATAGTITILNTHTVTVAADVSADQVTMQAGGGLSISSGITFSIVDGSGNDLVLNATSVLSVAGILSKAATAVITGTTAGNTSFLNGSTYHHLNTTTEGTIPVATWDANSTLQLTGYTTGRTMSSPTWSQNFGHVIWNCTGQTSITNFNNLLTSIQGDFLIQSTNSNVLQLSSVAPVSVTIGRDLAVSGNSRFYFTTNGNLTLNVGRDLIYNSTNASGSFFCSSGTATASIGGDFSMNASGGVLYVGAGSPSSGLATFNINGDFTLQAGTFLENGSSSQAVLNFNNGVSHLFTNTGTINGTVDYLVGTNDELTIAPTSWAGGVNGTGVTSDFIINGTLVVQSSDALGALRNGTTLGNVRTPVASRVYNSGATIVYNNTSAAQAIGDGHPAVAGVNTTIDNANGLTFASNVNSVTITGNLSLDNGSLLITSTSSTTKTLTISGNLFNNGGTIASSGPSTDIVVTGSGTTVNLPFLAGSETVRNFTVNKSSGSATVVSSLIVSGTLSLTAGNFNFSDQTLTLNGSLTYGTGTLSPNAASTLVISGPFSTSVGTLSFSPSANTIGTLTINRPGASAATINSTVIIASTLNLTRSALTNTSGLTMGNGSTIVRSSLGSLLGNRPTNIAGNSYSVTYSGSTTTTGLELPAAADAEDLANLTIDGGPITLNQNIIINGVLNLNASTFTVGAFAITMEGTNWNDNAGTISLGTTPVVFNGVNTIIGGSSITAFRDIQVNNGANVTLPSGSLTISEDITVISGGSFDANGGTVLLNGSTLQTISASGSTLHNLTVNKPSGLDVSLTSNLNISGTLNVQSANSDFASGGFLTLLSTSDSSSGTGSIAALLNNATVSGNVTVQRFWNAEGKVNRYISSPITNAPVSQLQDDFPVTGPFTGSSYSTCGPSPCTNDGYSLKHYDETFSGANNKGYRGYPTSVMDASATLVPGRGYLAFMWESAAETWDVTGPINRGTIPFTITHTPSTPTPIPDADGWNLIGNPYPSSIVWNDGAGWTRNQIAPVISVPDVPSGVFRTSNYQVPNAGDLPNDVIASGQAFWVYANQADASMSINEQAKTNSTGTFYRERQNLYPVLAISLTQGAVTDNSFLIIHPEATTGYDALYDGYKMEGEELAISISDKNQSKWVMYAIPQVENNVILPLSVKASANKTYTISVEPRDGFDLREWTLFDQQEDMYITLSNAKSYNFKATSGSENRFFLVRGNVSLETPEQRISIYPNPATDKVTIQFPETLDAEVMLAGSMGNVLSTTRVKTNDNKVELDVKNYGAGVYLLLLKTSNSISVHKLIKK